MWFQKRFRKSKGDLYKMIRLLAGLFFVLGAVGGIEHFNLSIIVGFFFGVLGLILMIIPINNGSLDRYLEK